jgi:hypothetical protein
MQRGYENQATKAKPMATTAGRRHREDFPEKNVTGEPSRIRATYWHTLLCRLIGQQALVW